MDEGWSETRMWLVSSGSEEMPGGKKRTCRDDDTSAKVFCKLEDNARDPEFWCALCEDGEEGACH